MKFQSDGRPGALLVRSYSAREVRVGDQVFTTSFLLTAQQHLGDWAPTEVATLSPAAFEPLEALAPELVLLGTGARQQFPAPALYAWFAARRMGFEAMDTGAACRTYNVLASEGRRVALAVVMPG